VLPTKTCDDDGGGGGAFDFDREADDGSDEADDGREGMGCY
jgi:hypothetical protein